MKRLVPIILLVFSCIGSVSAKNNFIKGKVDDINLENGRISISGKQYLINSRNTKIYFDNNKEPRGIHNLKNGSRIKFKRNGLNITKIKVLKLPKGKINE